MKYPSTSLSILIGLTVSSKGFAKERIIGGEQSDAGDWPWFARGTYFGDWWGCGGALVTPEFVLTAAHCNWDTDAGFQIGALCDPYGPSASDNCGQKVESFETKKVFDHPNYNSVTSDNDFSLIQLKDQATIAPVPMDQGSLSLSAGAELWAIGFGNTDTSNPYYPKRLRDVAVEYVTNSQCNSGGSYDGEITDNMLCAGVSEGGKDACQGDSGGPLYDLKNNKLVGVTSWGYGCAVDIYPGVYARISEQWNWIKTTICANHSNKNKPGYCEGSTPAPTDAPTPAQPTNPPDTPSPTKADTPSPVFDNDCDSDEVFAQLDLKTDQYADETAWSLSNVLDGSEIASEQYGAGDSDKTFSYKFCIPIDTCVEFKITDSYGDGIIYPGFFDLTYDGEVILSSTSHSNGDFGDKDEVAFNCPNPCPDDQSTVTLDLSMDDYPSEVSWSFTDTDGNSILDSPAYNTDSHANKDLQTKFCIEKDSCVTFKIEDSYADGIIGGGYEVYVDDEKVAENPSGDWSEQEHKFGCVDTPAPTPSSGPSCEDEEGKIQITIDGKLYKKKCFQLAKKGFCDTSAELRARCSESCGVDCGGDDPAPTPSPGQSCEDEEGKIQITIDGKLYKKKCFQLANKGFCDTSAELRARCPESCGFDCDNTPTSSPDPCEARMLAEGQVIVDGDHMVALCDLLVSKDLCDQPEVSHVCGSSCV